MNDIFKDMQTNVGCEYLSDLPSYKRQVWQEMKRLNLADYEEKQLEDFSKYVFGMSYQAIKDVMKQHHIGSTCRQTLQSLKQSQVSVQKVKSTTLSKRYCPLLMKSMNIQACTSSTNQILCTASFRAICRKNIQHFLRCMKIQKHFIFART